MCKIDWNLVIQSFIAIGTVSVAIFAIWGNWFKSRFIPPKLKIVEQNLRGELTQLTGPNFQTTRVIYYHLKVVNSRNWSTAKNCKVLLTEVHLRLPNGQFQRIPLNAFHSFRWTPAELTGLTLDISHDQIFDFGRILEAGNRFEPTLSSYPNNFNGFVTANNAVRYTLKIVAEGYESKKPQVFEVAWNGNWSDNMDIMTRNVTIQEIDTKSSN